MVDNFGHFAQLVAKSFQKLAKNPIVFTVDITGDDLYAAYLASFPEGTNPRFKERTEHDCSTCKSFVRRIGNVVTVENGELQTVWDDAGKKAIAPYAEVATALSNLVKSKAIKDRFLMSKKENSVGAEKTRSLDANERVISWTHFFTGIIPDTVKHISPDEIKGEYRSTVHVFERGLTELKQDAIDTVLSLIESNSLYRGKEHLAAVRAFQKVQNSYLALTKDHDRFLWANATGPASRFRNTVIGTLVQDLSEGKPIEKAVGAFESKVAPQNYKRTSSLITPAMVKAAMSTIQELDLESALERRFARIEDISVNDVLWVDNSVKTLMKGGLEDMLMKHTVKPIAVKVENAQEITIDNFIQQILPTSSNMEIFFKGAHVNNLMSLTAPIHAAPKSLFKWDNDFAWSYVGNIADSDIRKAVQARGGRVDGVFRFSHSWNYDARNASLMDLHVFMPGSNIMSVTPLNAVNDHYGNNSRVGWNHRSEYKSGGVQDVDYTTAAPPGYVPVENITFPSLEKMPQGKYICKIHNWHLRPPTEGGFRAEIEFAGQIFEYEVTRPLKNKEWVAVATVTLKDGAFTIEHHLPHGTTSQAKWGLNTETFVKVNAVTLSPNYWGDNAVGNKHTFFVLEGAKNDEPTRGIYNEFLHSRLESHRKVFEIIGDKTKCQPTEGQLSGLGFSSTKQDSVLIRVKQDNKQRLFNVTFGN